MLVTSPNYTLRLMRPPSYPSDLLPLMSQLDTAGVAIEYVFHEGSPTTDSFARHRTAAIEGMEEIARRLDHRPIDGAPAESSLDLHFHVRWDLATLSGKPVSFGEFWGVDDVKPRATSKYASSLPEVNGYKSAFFLPPYGLRGSIEAQSALFAAINLEVFGSDMAQSEIFAWSTNWSNYFDAGHEWWGAFYWTVLPAGSNRMVTIGASSTD